MATSVWKIANSINGIKNVDMGQYAVLILNQPIRISQPFIADLWNGASLRVTADGGTDRWYEFVSNLKNGIHLKQRHPDLTTGDFDSIKPETLQLVKESGVKVIPTPDQDKTDFTKALEEIIKHTNGKIDNVLAVVENGGRLDHIMSNLNTLYTAREEVFRREGHEEAANLYLLSGNSVTWLLSKGLHTIHVPRLVIESEAVCGLIPLGAPCVASTTGLKWNLDKDKMEFGGLISTCNTYSPSCNGVVTVETDGPLLWTMTL